MLRCLLQVYNQSVAAVGRTGLIIIISQFTKYPTNVLPIPISYAHLYCYISSCHIFLFWKIMSLFLGRLGENVSELSQSFFWDKMSCDYLVELFHGHQENTSFDALSPRPNIFVADARNIKLHHLKLCVSQCLDNLSDCTGQGGIHVIVKLGVWCAAWRPFFKSWSFVCHWVMVLLVLLVCIFSATAGLLVTSFGCARTSIGDILYQDFCPLPVLSEAMAETWTCCLL